MLRNKGKQKDTRSHLSHTLIEKGHEHPCEAPVLRLDLINDDVGVFRFLAEHTHHRFGDLLDDLPLLSRRNAVFRDADVDASS